MKLPEEFAKSAPDAANAVESLNAELAESRHRNLKFGNRKARRARDAKQRRKAGS